ncbi:MAG: DNA-binding response regulator, partial [Deltaproteobacteria bacterium]|nr:DNA-binding response regulator [Deltaproteobacteria bacterium]
MPEKILVVDDEQEMLQVLSRSFKRKGYEVQCAE